MLKKIRDTHSLGLIEETARWLVGVCNGLLAIDESNGTGNKRFAALGIAASLPWVLRECKACPSRVNCHYTRSC
jgi:hypothetical protein